MKSAQVILISLKMVFCPKVQNLTLLKDYDAENQRIRYNEYQNQSDNNNIFY